MMSKVGGRIPKNELYTDFVEDNPDFAPKSKMMYPGLDFLSGWLHSLYIIMVVHLKKVEICTPGGLDSDII